MFGEPAAPPSFRLVPRPGATGSRPGRLTRLAWLPAQRQPTVSGGGSGERSCGSNRAPGPCRAASHLSRLQARRPHTSGGSSLVSRLASMLARSLVTPFPYGPKWTYVTLLARYRRRLASASARGCSGQALVAPSLAERRIGASRKDNRYHRRRGRARPSWRQALRRHASIPPDP